MRGQFIIAARIGRRQHGRVTRRQLLDEGVDATRLDRWLVDGRLRSVHRGVYAIGHTAPSWLATHVAAVLAGGRGAVLSHRAAAYLLKLLRGPSPPPEITVPSTNRRARPGIVIHRVRALHPRDVCVVEGIPVTVVPRVLLDLAPSLDMADLTRACHEAWVHHRVTPPMIEACIARNPNKPGATKLRHAFGADVTLSRLEDAFVGLVEEHGLPLPRTNLDVRGDKVDCRWEQHGLTIELHCHGFHASRYGFENDITRRRRSNHVPFSYGDVVDRGPATAAELRALLDQAEGGLTATARRRTHVAVGVCWRARGLCPRNLRPIGRLWTLWTAMS